MGSGPKSIRGKLIAGALFAASTIAVALSVTAPVHAAAGINQQMNFQGRLLNAQGAAVPDGFYNIQFKIYQDGDGQSVGDTTGSPAGSLKWTESHLNANSQGVKVVNGFLSVQLGSVTPFGSSVDWNQDTLWLSMNIGDTNTTCTPFSSCTPDGEMVPMKRMSATAYALNAQNANTLGGLTAGNFIQNTTSVQSSASIAIQSAADSNITAFFQGRTNQSAASLQIKNGGSQSGEYIKVLNGSDGDVFKIDAFGILHQYGQSIFDKEMAIGTSIGSAQLRIVAQSGNLGLDVTGNGTQDILHLQSGSSNTRVLTIADNGTTTFQTQTDSASAFQVKQSATAGGATVLGVDTGSKAVNTGGDVNVGSAANRGSAGRLFSDGFESGNFNLWSGGASSTGSTTVTADTSVVRNGKYSAKMTNNNGVGIIRTSIKGGTTTAARSYVYVSSQASGDAGLMTLIGGSNYFGLFRQASNGRLAYWNGPTLTATQGSTVLTTGAWHKIELVLTISNTTGSATVYIDDTAVLTLTNIDTGTTLPDTLRLGDDATGVTYTAYFDDAAADSIRPGDSANLNINDSLHVAGSASFGSPALFQSASNSTAALQVLNASGTTTVLDIDTTNARLGIGNAAPGYALDVTGDINSSTGYRVGGTAGTSVTCSGGNFLQNATISGGIVTAGSCAAATNGVTTVGTFVDTTSYANGAQISGNTITFGAADGTNPGLVSTGAQTFAGNKTFSGNTTFNGTTTQTTSGTADSATVNSTNTSGIQANGILFNRNGAAGTTTNGINVTNTAGTLTNGLAFTGSIGTDINRGSGTLTIQGAGGVQISSSGGNISLASDTSVASGKSITFVGGVSNFDQSASSGTFKTGTGAVSINGDTTLAAGKTLSASGNITTTTTVQGAIINATTKYQINGTDGATVSCSGGTFLQNATVTGGIATAGSCANAVTTIGTFAAGTSYANGATISGNTLTFGAADATNPGLVSTSTQTFAGDKTFSGTVLLQSSTPSTSLFNIKNSTSNNVFTVDATNGRVGINLGGNVLPTLTNSGIEVQGAIRLSGGSGNADTFTTPGGASLSTKINIPFYDPGNFNQILALGLPSTASSTARAISMVDARASAHQATIGVLSPDEAQIGGFSWDGSNTTFLVKNSAATVALQGNGLNLITATNTAGSATVGIGNANTTYALDVTGEINASTGFRVGGTAGATTTCSGGNFLQNAAISGGIVTGGSCASAVTTVGTFAAGTSYANGASISGNTITLGAADGTNPGLVSTSTQTFAGDKTFSGDTTIASGKSITYAGGASNFDQSASSGTFKTGSGNVSLNGNTTVAANLTVTAGATALTGPAAGSSNALTVTTGATNNTGLIINAASGQTADLLAIKDGATATQIKVDAGGSLYVSHKPTTSASNGALIVGDAAAQSNGDINGVIGFLGSGVQNAQIAYAVGDGFYLCNSSASSASGDYGQCSSRVNIYAQDANFNGNFLQSGSGTFGTGTGAVSLNGAVSVAANKSFSLASGTGTFTQTYAAGSGTAATINANATAANTVTNGLNVAAGGAGTVTNGINISQSAGTLTNGLQFTGTMTNLINATNFTVTSAGNVTAAGTIRSNTGFNINGTAGSTITCSGGQLLQDATTVGGIVTGGTCVTVSTGGSGVTTVGAIDTQTKSANGAVIVGTTIYMQTADGSAPGLVSTGAQNFAGNKTFNNDVTVSGNLAVTGTINSNTFTSSQLTFGGAINSVINSASSQNLVLNGANTLILRTGGTTRVTYDSSSYAAYYGNGITNASPVGFTLSGTGSTTTAVAGGALTIQGGNSTVGNANGGNLNLSGGTGVGTGVNGLVILSTPTFSAATSDANCYTSGAVVASSCTITNASVNSNSTIVVGFNQTGQVATLPDPIITTVGRVVYITAANGSSDFTLRVNGGGTGNDIAMRQGTSATMIWNGVDWTAAGASSSTTLQSAYDNTLQSAGGAELVVSKTSTTNGLTIRDSLVNSVNGTLLSVQTSSAANLLSVNSNVTDYATNGGAETAGASSSTFPANTWSAVSGSTVTRYTTAGSFIPTGQASVSVATPATANAGVANKLNTSLTANMIYNVSFATRLSAGTFTDMNVYYSVDGTAASVACTTTQAVTTSIQTKVNCAFTAPSSGITSSNAILIRQTAASNRTFYVDNLSVTIAADYNYVTDGSVIDAANFATNWSAVGGSTVTRSTSVGNDASNSAQVVAAGVSQGVRAKLSINPLTSTVYRLSVYVSSNTSGFNSFNIRYSRDGGTNFTSCADYNTQAISSTITDFTKVTCYITTDGTAASSPYVYFTQTDAVSRTFYVDTFAMTLSTNTTPNVQVGGGVNGGPITLFTLDRAAAAPIASNNEALLGSMYYDTTLGKLQCYEADGWGACGSSPDNIVTISPEFTNAVMHGTGVGTMTSDICSDPLNINDGSSGQPTICGTNETFNFYKWTSPQPTAQTYSIYVTYQLPSTFKAFASGQTSVMGRTDSTNSTVQFQIYRNNSVTGLTACGSAVTVSTGVQSSWQFKTASGAADPSTCSFAGGDSIVFKIDMISNSTANAYLSNLNFTFSNK